MIRLAMLSFWHVHARDYARQAQAHPEAEIVAVWDEDEQRGSLEALRLGVPFYRSLSEVLSQDIDGVIVDAPTNIHFDVILEALKYRKHVFTEKVLTLTYREALRIVEEARRANCILTVSLPRIGDRYTIAIKNILYSGLLGNLTYARVRLAHNGALANWLPQYFYSFNECGGGALTDLGCHPLYLLRIFLGMPERLVAQYGYFSDKEVEDNAVAVLSYSNGALGVVEAAFVSSHSHFSIEIFGTKGSLIYGFPQNKLLLKENEAENWIEYTLPSSLPSVFEQWISCIKSDRFPYENIELALDLSKLVEACNLSWKRKSTVELSEISG
ncbi:Gfo/Idh/MocA family protein [Alicyclobacillus sendaiensis]|uniref:Gfo/Idh/MocA family oxidoreductase n=1 Tax=Alicyclobacillus sendaiensis PA2 TaxID=3029425 RepID=A0ABT6Y1G9_ALISE|nr:Gfo/Idh/MocA family oxidoreductase [Alicyclobacillus sendaiensis]MDI9261166.1 Gfo/Idh/MocA family oxidoreductase [Alicyclobacillus sendaiensis PA2]